MVELLDLDLSKGAGGVDIHHGCVFILGLSVVIGDLREGTASRDFGADTAWQYDGQLAEGAIRIDHRAIRDMGIRKIEFHLAKVHQQGGRGKLLPVHVDAAFAESDVVGAAVTAGLGGFGEDHAAVRHGSLHLAVDALASHALEQCIQPHRL